MKEHKFSRVIGTRTPGIRKCLFYVENGFVTLCDFYVILPENRSFFALWGDAAKKTFRFFTTLNSFRPIFNKNGLVLSKSQFAKMLR